MKKILWTLALLLGLNLPLTFADSPLAKQRKQNLRELGKKLTVQQERENLMGKELTSRRKEMTISVFINQEDLEPRYDAQNKITGYSFSLRSFFDKVIDKEPKIFYYPLQVYAIKLHYKGANVATVGWCGSKLHAGLYSDYKFGGGRFLFTQKKLNYGDDLFIYFESNDKMDTEITVQYQGIDSISPGGVKHWETDLKRLPPYREQFYKSIPKIASQEKDKSLFLKVVNLLNFIKTKYSESGPQVRRLIEQNYPGPWMTKLRKMMEERNRRIERVLESLDELYESNKNKKASFNLNEIIQREYLLEKELKKALNTSDIEKYLHDILKQIQDLEKGKE